MDKENYMESLLMLSSVIYLHKDGELKRKNPAVLSNTSIETYFNSPFVRHVFMVFELPSEEQLQSMPEYTFELSKFMSSVMGALYTHEVVQAITNDAIVTLKENNPEQDIIERFIKSVTTSNALIIDPEYEPDIMVAIHETLDLIEEDIYDPDKQVLQYINKNITERSGYDSSTGQPYSVRFSSYIRR